jgi:hypothetical protein
VKVSLRTVVPSVLLILLSSACTGGDDQPPTPSTSSPAPGEGVNTKDAGDVEFIPGRFEYRFNDIIATLSMDGSRGTLDVENDSGASLEAPAMYVIAGDGTRYDGSVEAAATIPDGGTASFRVTFPDQVKPDSVGLAVLLFGDSNYGALAPVPVA